MTLCTAHIRQVNDTEELVFATDSHLNGGGEKWDKGVKLFEMPNKDALLCFTGTTSRAYPLILNLVSSIDYDDDLFTRAYTVVDLKDYILELFSSLITSITDTVDDKHKVRGEARFLFGGWDWKSDQFKIWYIQYSPEEEEFIATELTDDTDKTNFYVFIGEAKYIDVENEANEKLTELLIDTGRIHCKLDMEPLQILRDFSTNSNIEGVGGSLQIGKVYKSNKTEFLGVYWPSSKGIPCFQGREYNEINKPLIRYFNPDTFEIIESDLPEHLQTIDEETYPNDYELVRECYDEDGYLKDTVSEKQKHLLRLVFKDLAYRQFINSQQGEPQI
jgi:hypothetical protein